MELLRIASVEGDTFTAEVLASILDRDILEIISQLSGQLDKRYRIITAEGSQRLNGQRLSLYSFRHILFQRHLYGQLDSIERVHLHERVGETLEMIYGAQVDQIATQLSYQYNRAGIAIKAVKYLQMAADRARKLSAYSEAVTLLRNAIEYLPEIPPGSGRRQLELVLQTSLGMSLAATKGFAAPEVQEAYVRARSLCTEVGEPPQLFPILYGLRTYSLVRAEYRDSKGLADQLLQVAQKEEDQDLLLEATQAIGAACFYLGELKDSKEYLERGVKLYQIEKHHDHALRFGQDPCVICCSYLALLAWSEGEKALALRRSSEAIAVAEQVAHPFTMGLALSFASILYHIAGEHEQALVFAESTIDLAVKYDFPVWGALGAFIQGSIHAIEEPEIGIQEMQQSLFAWEKLGSRLGLSQYQGMLAEAMGHAKQTKPGLEVIENALRQCEQSGEFVFKPDLLRIKGDLLAAEDDAAEAERIINEALSLAKEMEIAPFALRAALKLFNLLRETPKQAEAERELRRTYRLFGARSDTLEAEMVRTVLD